MNESEQKAFDDVAKITKEWLEGLISAETAMKQIAARIFGS